MPNPDGNPTGCVSCLGAGVRFAGLGGPATPCPICEGTGVREVCDDFTPQGDASAPGGRRCVSCWHREHAHVTAT